LTSSNEHSVTTFPPKEITGAGILFVFLLCAVFDFVRGDIGGHSVPAGLITVVGGIFGTAFYLLLFWPRRSG